MRPTQHARVVLEAVSYLNRSGYGRLRILCYVKEGLGAWRHRLFVSDGFVLSEDLASNLFSLPGNPIADGETPEVLASNLLAEFPALMAAAKGPSAEYAEWLRRTLETYPDGVFVMERPDRAMVGAHLLVTPFSRKLNA